MVAPAMIGLGRGARRRALAWGAVLGLALAAIAYMATVPPGEPLDRDVHGGEAAAPAYLVPVAMEAVTAVELVLRGAVVRFERDAAGLWYRHGHGHAAPHGGDGGHEHATDAGAGERIARALDTFARARIERTVARGAFDRAAYGVDAPALIAFLFAGGEPRPAATFYFGAVAPDTLSRYVLATDRGALVTIPDFHAANLLDLLAATGAAPTE